MGRPEVGCILGPLCAAWPGLQWHHMIDCISTRVSTDVAHVRC